MTEFPGNDVVARQYKKWQYPQPIEDLATWSASHMEWFDPRYAHRVFWPDRPYQADLDILVAGCGTNQAPTIAFNNRAAKVVGIDVSEESLDHGRYLKHKHDLANLDLRLLPIEEVGALGADFDLVIASGVLHHMASPEAGMAALGGVLRPGAVAAVMLYARYGRVGVEMMQSVFADMELGQDEASLAMARGALDFLEAGHPAKIYTTLANDLGYDAGIVDTFLHGRDRSFTAVDCMDLVESAGLVFQDWFLQAPLNPPVLVHQGNEFLAAVRALPERLRWSVMERLQPLNGNYLFTACRSDRPTASYRIDFDSPAAAGYVPQWRAHAGINGEKIVRIGAGIAPVPAQRTLAEQVDGLRSIREIAAAAGEPEQRAVAFFDELRRLDFIAVALGGSPA